MSSYVLMGVIDVLVWWWVCGFGVVKWMWFINFVGLVVYIGGFCVCDGLVVI